MLPEGSSDLLRDRLFASYVDRMAKGERLNPEQIRADHPDLAEELIKDLAVLQEVGSPAADAVPLGALGDYQLLRKIGRGGMGVVYEAWQGSVERRVALKVLPAGVASDARVLSRFLREAKVAARLHHPNIVPVYGMGVDRDSPHYAMEMIEGETLAQLLARLRSREDGPTTEGVTAPSSGRGLLDSAAVDAKYCLGAAEAFAAVAEGLQHAHQNGIIHRDIKPSNLILDEDGRLRILDFGLARFEGQESLTVSGDLLGTPLYMSPEQARARKVPIDHRTDIYSLGATLYEVLSRRPPFRGKDHADTLSQIVSRDPTPLRRWNPRIPKDLETIVLKCLGKDPADRYGTTEALAQDLRRFARGDPVEARPQASWEKLIRRAARRKGALAAASVLILLLAAVGWLASRTHREARLRSEESYAPSVRRAVELLQLDALNRRAEAWEPLVIDRTGEVFRPGFPRDAFARGDRGPVETAVDELQAAAAALPRRPDAPYYLAKGLLLLERTDDALRALDHAAGADPGFVPALVLRAAVLKRRGEREAAQALTEQAERTARGTWAEAWLAARRFEKRRLWTEARASFEALIQLEATGREPYVGASVEARVGRAVARLEERDLGGALQDLGVARFLWPEAVEPALLEAKAYYLLGEKNKTAGLLAGLHRGARFEDDVAVGVMAVYISLRDYDQVLEWAERLRPGYVREAMLAEAFVLLGRLEEAEHAARAALGQRPSDVQASVVLASILFAGMHRYDEGLKVLDACLERNPTDPEIHSQRARLFSDLGNHELAVESQRQALELDPRRTSSWSNLGLHLVGSGKGAEAAEKLRRACAMEPEDPWAWNNLGCGLAHMSRLDEAIDAFLEASRVDPGHAWPYWNRGQALERLGRLDESLAEHRKSLHLLPLSLAGFADAGRILERQGKTEEALAAYLDALEVEPWDGVTHGCLSALLRRLGPGPSGACLDRLAVCLEKAYPKGTRDSRILDTFALALAFAPGREDLDRALELAFRGVEEAAKSPPVLADLVATLSLLLRRMQAERSLAAHPLAMLARLPEYSVLDGLLDHDREREPESERQLVEKLRDAEPAGEALQRLVYLEGRLLERAGSHREAAEKYARLAGEDASHPEPLLRLAECLRAAGDPEAAVAALDNALSAGALDDRRLWDLHLAISFADLKREPGDLLRLIPESATGHAAAIRWLLERLGAGEPIRIDCGGQGFTSRAGGVWAGDRFFTGGHTGGCLSIEIEGTEDDRLCQTERWFPGTGSLAEYRLPVPPGLYRITLHFAETWFHAQAMRRFDVLIEGRLALEDHEPFAAGVCTAHAVVREARVADGILDLTFVHQVDNPMAAGIEVERLEG